MMLLFSINTFMPLTHALSTLRRVLVARFTAMLIASSKLWSEMALISVTRATLIYAPPLVFPTGLLPLPQDRKPLALLNDHRAAISTARALLLLDAGHSRLPEPATPRTLKQEKIKHADRR